MSEFVEQLDILANVPFRDEDFCKISPIDVKNFPFELAYAVESREEDKFIRIYSPNPYKIITNYYDLYLYTISVFEKFKSVDITQRYMDFKKPIRLVSIFMGFSPYCISLIYYPEDFRSFTQISFKDGDGNVNSTELPVRRENSLKVVYEFNSFKCINNCGMDRNEYHLKLYKNYTQYASNEEFYYNYVHYRLKTLDRNSDSITSNYTVPRNIIYIIKEMLYKTWITTKDITRQSNLLKTFCTESEAIISDDTCDIFTGRRFVL